MTDWLDKFREETEQIRLETEQIRAETEQLRKVNKILKNLTHEKLSKIVAKCTKMNYTTYIDIKRYSSTGDFYFTLKITNDIMEDFYYDGNAPTLEEVMQFINLYLKNHSSDD